MTAKKEPTSNNTEQSQEADSPSPGMQSNRPPPSYDTLYPPTANNTANTSRSRLPKTVSSPGAENINTLRNGSPRLVLDPPLPKLTPLGTAKAAAKTAMLGTGRALSQSDPAVVAAHTAHAIAIAVSTSRSYIAFVAATTSAESAALIAGECNRGQVSRARTRQRAEDAIQRAAELAVAADAGNTATVSWPCNTQ